MFFFSVPIFSHFLHNSHFLCFYFNFSCRISILILFYLSLFWVALHFLHFNEFQILYRLQDGYDRYVQFCDFCRSVSVSLYSENSNLIPKVVWMCVCDDSIPHSQRNMKIYNIACHFNEEKRETGHKHRIDTFKHSIWCIFCAQSIYVLDPLSRIIFGMDGTVKKAKMCVSNIYNINR